MKLLALVRVYSLMAIRNEHIEIFQTFHGCETSAPNKNKVLLGNIEAYQVLSFNIFSVPLYVPRVAFTLFFQVRIFW